ncbi:MAG TPA: response regulator [Kofleriaceae bacterium]|nr:response regulator [Kofleriaceae bacterium]
MTKYILLVEDNPADEKLTLRAFKQSGVMNEVTVVRDGAEALDYLLGTGSHSGRDIRELPTVMLLDLKLPRISGLEVLRRVRETEPIKLLPIVILTSSKEEEDIARSYELGANAYVRKPVELAEFVVATKTLGLFWLLINEAPPERSP